MMAKSQRFPHLVVWLGRACLNLTPASQVHCALVVGSLSLLAAVVPGQATGGPVEKEPAKGRTAAGQAAKMVEAIANRNKQPKIVSRRREAPQSFPLYPDDYSWTEEGRVRGALAKLKEDTSVELWEALVQKANDKRYCIASYSGSSADVELWSVGDICRELAYSRLCNVFMKHLPSYPPDGSPIQMRDDIKDFPTWREARNDKALYQLQIEVCEIALRKLPKVRTDKIPDKEKAEVKKKIQAEIAELRKSEKPIMEGGSIPRLYPCREAERVRKAYEKDSLEEFNSGIDR